MKRLPWVEENSKINDAGAIGWGLPAGPIEAYRVRYAIKELPTEESHILKALRTFNELSRGRKMFNVCPGSGECLAYCYARKGSYRFPSVAAHRVRALAWTFHAEFVGQAVSDLSRVGKKYVRIHDSGDFYSQEYLDKWIEIMRAVPEKTFYAYTKNFRLDFDQAPKNFIRAQSEGGRFPDEIVKSLPIVSVSPRGTQGSSTNADREIQRGKKRVRIEMH